VLLAGCGGGGALGASSLATRSDTVRSLAAEGALLARDGADGKTTSIFTREHGSFLSQAASTTTSSLRKARAKPALEPQLRRLRTLSARVRDQLKRLDGASRAEQRQIADTLGEAADEAEKISASVA
jgi:hypothetical protein